MEMPGRCSAGCSAETIAARTGRVVLDPNQFTHDPGTRLTGTLAEVRARSRPDGGGVVYDAALARGADAVTTNRFEARVPVAALDAAPRPRRRSTRPPTRSPAKSPPGSAASNRPPWKELDTDRHRLQPLRARSSIADPLAPLGDLVLGSQDVPRHGRGSDRPGRGSEATSPSGWMSEEARRSSSSPSAIRAAAATSAELVRRACSSKSSLQRASRGRRLGRRQRRGRSEVRREPRPGWRRLARWSRRPALSIAYGLPPVHGVGRRPLGARPRPRSPRGPELAG